MNEKKRHNLVPEFYLKHFADGDGNVWNYDKHEDNVFSASTDNSSVGKQGYDITEKDGSFHSAMEGLLGEIEGEATPLLQKIKQGEQLEGKERATFAIFLAIMFARSNAHREIYGEFIIAAFKKLNITSSDDTLKEYLRMRAIKRDSMSSEERGILRDTLIKPENYKQSLDKGVALAELILSDTMAHIINEMQWTIFRAPAGLFFITSDNPVTEILPKEHQLPLVAEVFFHEQTRIFLPLTPKRCLMAHWIKNMPAEASATKNNIYEFNHLQTFSSDRFVYAHKNRPEILKLAIHYKGGKKRLEET